MSRSHSYKMAQTKYHLSKFNQNEFQIFSFGDILRSIIDLIESPCTLNTGKGNENL